MNEQDSLPTNELVVRPVVDADWPELTQLIREAAASKDAFTYDPDLTDAQAKELWGGTNCVVVAQAADGTIAGTAKMSRNQQGPGDHVATASFLVAPGWRRRGVGRLLCRHALSWAADAGFRAMQFNAVVSTNEPAVKLWQSEGFAIVGIVPQAFRHPEAGLVDLFVMHRPIGDSK